MPVYKLNKDILFPPPELAEENGLLAIGGDLRPERLLTAYRLGVFPWYSEGEPILWWSPSPRLVLFPEEFHVPRRLARIIRQHPFSLTADTDFQQVVEACAETRIARGEETWITRDMINAYCRLHELGFAHSIECRQKDVLVGGLYGIAMGRVFFGESMFSTVSNASKIALHSLVDIAGRSDIRMIDCQMKTAHLLRLGAKEIPGAEFRKRLTMFIKDYAPQKKWRLHNEPERRKPAPQAPVGERKKKCQR